MTTLQRPPLPEQPGMSPAARLLARHGVSAGDIAAQLGVHRSYVSHQLAGRRRYSPALLDAVAYLAGWEVAYAVEAAVVDAGGWPVRFEHSDTVRLLHRAGLTLHDVAVAAGTSLSQVSRVIRGRSTSAPVRTAVVSAVRTLAGDRLPTGILEELAAREGGGA